MCYLVPRARPRVIVRNNLGRPCGFSVYDRDLGILIRFESAVPGEIRSRSRRRRFFGQNSSSRPGPAARLFTVAGKRLRLSVIISVWRCVSHVYNFSILQFCHCRYLYIIDVGVDESFIIYPLPTLGNAVREFCFSSFYAVRP